MSRPNVRCASPGYAFRFTVGLREANLQIDLALDLRLPEVMRTIIGGAGVHDFVHDARHLLGFPCH